MRYTNQRSDQKGAGARTATPRRGWFPSAAVIGSVVSFAAGLCLASGAFALAIPTDGSNWERVATPADAAQLAQAAPTGADYPDADAIVLFQSTAIDIAGDGRVTRRVHTVRRLVTPWAVRRGSDVRVNWDSRRQDLEIHVCRTVMRDGTVVATPERGFNDVTPRAVARAADFADIREMVISHVGTETGCVVELAYTITDRLPPPLPPSGIAYLQGADPIVYGRFTAASRRPLTAIVRQTGAVAVASQRSRSDTGITRLWIVQDVPGLPSEGNAAYRPDYLPHVLYSAADDWFAVAEPWREATEGAAVADSVLIAWLDQTPAAAESEDLTPLDRVRRVATLIADGVRTVELPTGAWSRSPRPAKAVFNSACGTDWEKGTLALALLRAAGLAPELGFFTGSVAFADTVPATAAFAHVRVVVAVDGENYWLDPRRSDIRPGRCDLGGRSGLFFEDQPGGFRTYRVAEPSGASTLTVAIRPAEPPTDGLVAAIDLAASGVLWRAGLEADQLAETLAAAVLHEAEVTEVKTDRIGPSAVRLRVHARASALAEAVDGLIAYRLPAAPVTIDDCWPAGFDASERLRQTPLFCETSCREELSLRIALPGGHSPDYLPASCEATSDHARYRLEVRHEGGQISLTRIRELSPGRIEPEHYAAFRAVAEAALRPNLDRIVLQQEAPAAP